MAKAKRILAIDVGASRVVVAEFAVTRGRVPELTRYGVGHLTIDPESDTHKSALLVSTIREVLLEHGIKPAELYLAISGQTVFPRYVKLPPVGKDKLYQIVRYEAEQNVPFPIDEVVWDYQLLPGEQSEMNVMLVAVKVENVTRLTDCVQAAHLEPKVVDAAPMALYNAVDYMDPMSEGCTMVLDIGARSSNLIFVERGRVFSRSVPVAGNAITLEVAKTFGISFEEAEEAKKLHAEVGLGGNYEGPEDEGARQIAKMVRTVFTRLHAEVNRSINFYRSQQGGSAPSRVLLTGGASTITYADTFFEDKLGVPVEYLNPFAQVTVSSDIDESRISSDVQLLGEVVGLALRAAGPCPVEINLMPPDLVAIKTFRKRQPYFAAAASALILALLVFWGYTVKRQHLLTGQLTRVNARIQELQSVKDQLGRAIAARRKSEADVNSITHLVGQRARWAYILEGLHACMLEGMWLTSVEPLKDGTQDIVKLRLKGRGFDDELKKRDEPGGRTAIEVFRDNLRAHKQFSADTDITETPPFGPGDFAREFTLEVGLAEPLELE